MPPISTYMKCLLSWSAKMLNSAALCTIRTYIWQEITRLIMLYICNEDFVSNKYNYIPRKLLFSSLPLRPAT